MTTLLTPNRKTPKRSRIIAFTALLLLILMLIPSSSASSEPPSLQWRQTYPDFQATCVIQTADGGYALAGSTSANGNSLIKTDSSGNMQWQKAYGAVVSLAQTNDHNIVAFCENGDVTKINLNGEVVGTVSVGANRGVRQGIVTEDGDYIVVGNAVWQYQETYVWLRRINSQGNIIWDLNYTGGFEISTVINTVDRGCVMAGNWKNNFWLARLDSNGNQQWSQNYVYGNPLDAHYVYSAARTSDGGFILAGTGMWQSSGGMIPWLIKINSQGYEQWNLPYAQYGGDSFTAAMQTQDNGYYFVKPNSATLMGADGSGSEMWQTSLSTSVNRVSDYPAVCIIPTNDGGCVIAGSSIGNAFLIKYAPQSASWQPTVSVSSPQAQTYEASSIPLVFTVNGEGAQYSYILDGNQEVAISENTTLTNLAVGAHNLTVSARSSDGVIGYSAVVEFSVVNRFPIEIAAAGVAAGVVAAVGFLLYFKRQSLANVRRGDLKGLAKTRVFSSLKQNRLLFTLVVTGVCFLLVFVQFFFPYAYYSSHASSKGVNSGFEVGVTYVYERDSVEQIYDEVSHIKDLGLSVIRINLVCDSTNANPYLNTLTDTFFSAARQLGVKVALIVSEHATQAELNFYLDKWGSGLTYVQILNEPDVASSWDMGALFTDDEATSKFEDFYNIIQQHHLSAKLYTNFSPGFVVRTNLPIIFSEKLDFVGYDVFMDSFLTVSPDLVQLLQKITGKEIVIAEFGMSSSNDVAQSNYLISGLTLFKNMGLRGCWIVYWNDADNHYGIRGRLAEQKIGEWIAQNT